MLIRYVCSANICYAVRSEPIQMSYLTIRYQLLIFASYYMLNIQCDLSSVVCKRDLFDIRIECAN